LEEDLVVESREPMSGSSTSVAPAVAATALLGAVLMVVSLFLDWYAVKAQARGDFDRYTLRAWDVFEATDTLMLLVALATLGLIVLRSRCAGRAFLLGGVLTSGWIVVQLVDRPAEVAFIDRSDLSLQVGAWIGLLGALLIAGAGALSRRRHAQPRDV
jgi:hypothetical protein